MLIPFIIAAETIIASLLIISTAEYLMTEFFYVMRYLTMPVKTIIFLITLVFFFTVNYFSSKFRRAGKRYLPFLGILLIAVLFSYKKYQDFYNRLQEEPKIYSISSNWSIQAKRIVIEGKNFGWPHDQSKVVAGGEEFLVETWTPDRIVVSAPLTENFGQHNLRVVPDTSKKSRPIPFEFRDPIELQLKK